MADHPKGLTQGSPTSKNNLFLLVAKPQLRHPASVAHRRNPIMLPSCLATRAKPQAPCYTGQSPCQTSERPHVSDHDLALDRAAPFFFWPRFQAGLSVFITSTWWVSVKESRNILWSLSPSPAFPWLYLDIYSHVFSINFSSCTLPPPSPRPAHARC